MNHLTWSCSCDMHATMVTGYHIYKKHEQFLWCDYKFIKMCLKIYCSIFTTSAISRRIFTISYISRLYDLIFEEKLIFPLLKFENSN